MTEVTPNLPHLGNFCKYCFMGTLLEGVPCFSLLRKLLLTMLMCPNIVKKC